MKAEWTSWNGMNRLHSVNSMNQFHYIHFKRSEWVMDWLHFIDFVTFGKSTHSIRIHTAQAKRSELLGLYWVIAFIVVSLYRFTLAVVPFHSVPSFMVPSPAHVYIDFIPFTAAFMPSRVHSITFIDFITFNQIQLMFIRHSACRCFTLH